ncbi:MAG: hypothetical protein RI894_558 [Bacteroidota bacterium]|jgi:septal ring factor EnvC (AmiA/AmiB activator)
MLNKTTHFTILLLYCVNCAFAAPRFSPTDQPKRKELESKRKKLNEEIKQTNALLNSATSQRKANAADLATLQKQLRNREEVQRVIKEEIISNEDRALRAESLIQSLDTDMGRLQVDYGKIMRSAYRYQRHNTSLVFLFASNGFNDAYRRWQYLRRYNDYRKRQVQLIIETQKSLREQKVELEAARITQAELLLQEQQNTVAIKQETSKKDLLVKQLRQKEGNLQGEVSKLQAQKEALNSAIESAIRSNEKVISSRNRTDAALPKLDAGERILDANFAKNRGRLSPPVNGAIIGHFGAHPHPISPSIIVQSNGLTYRVAAGSPVKTVFDGKVNLVNFITGTSYCIIIEHGGYYTAYSGIGKASVSKGEKVNVGDVIGTVANNGEVEFQVWHGTQKMNPEVWVR